jgi:diaminopimelate epimerase
MKLKFYKYQGTGNDFVIIDNSLCSFDKTDTALIAKLCDRKLGIGADGLMLLEKDEHTDFKMVYYNADGKESSMCGNGGRCMVRFARDINLISNTTVFTAIDGLHKAVINDGVVELQMKEVTTINQKDSYMTLDTGSPHYVTICSNLEELDVQKAGSQIRYSPLFNREGINVNFVESQNANTFRVRTYERGVENETLSCGTGVTAVAIAMHASGKIQSNKVQLNTKGGVLQVKFNYSNGSYSDIWLIGPTAYVFKGEIIC